MTPDSLFSKQKIDSLFASHMNPFESYAHHLAVDPERVDSLWMWTICTFLVWFWLFKYRERMIIGLEGSNLLWEGGEQVTYFCFWSFFPLLFRVGFFKNTSETQLIALYINAGVLIYQITGKYIFDFFLRFTGRAPIPEETKTVTAAVVTETITKTEKP